MFYQISSIIFSKFNLDKVSPSLSIDEILCSKMIMPHVSLSSFCLLVALSLIIILLLLLSSHSKNSQHCPYSTCQQSNSLFSGGSWSISFFTKLLLNPGWCESCRWGMSFYHWQICEAILYLSLSGYCVAVKVLWSDAPMYANYVQLFSGHIILLLWCSRSECYPSNQAVNWVCTFNFFY